MWRETIPWSVYRAGFQEPIYPRIRLVIAENVPFRTSRASKTICASSWIWIGEFLLSLVVAMWVSPSQHILQQCFFLFRTRNTDFRDHVIAHYDGLPDIGTVFAILIENKYFRAIRTHSEVNMSKDCMLCTREQKFSISFPISCSRRWYRIKWHWLTLVKRSRCHYIVRKSINSHQMLHACHHWQSFV